MLVSEPPSTVLLPERSCWCAASTIQLVELDCERHPTGWGCGFAITHNNTRMVVTALHVALMRPGILLRLKDKQLGMEVTRLDDSWEFYSDKPKHDDGKQEHCVIDLATIKISDDVDLFRHDVTDLGQTGRGWKIREFDICNSSSLTYGEKCSFSGIIHPEDVSGIELKPGTTRNINVLFHTVEGVTYDANNGLFAQFRLPQNFPDEIDLSGTSGAPILNSKRQPVAMVTGGSIADRCVDAILFKDIKRLLFGEIGCSHNFKTEFRNDPGLENRMRQYFHLDEAS